MNPKAVANVVKFYEQAATDAEQCRRAGDRIGAKHFQYVADTLNLKAIELSEKGQPEALDAILQFDFEMIFP